MHASASRGLAQLPKSSKAATRALKVAQANAKVFSGPVLRSISSRTAAPSVAASVRPAATQLSSQSESNCTEGVEFGMRGYPWRKPALSLFVSREPCTDSIRRTNVCDRIKEIGSSQDGHRCRCRCSGLSPLPLCMGSLAHCSLS
jgi:hypothetical protein